MTNEEYIEAFRQWGIDRKIIGNGTFEGQWLKLISEIGELADSLAKGKSPIDDIGDCFVVLVMMDEIWGLDHEPSSVLMGIINAGDKVEPYISKIERLKFASRQAAECLTRPREILTAAYNLSMLATCCNLTVSECLAHAWNEIKDRKGYLNENGVFIKEGTNNVQA